MKSIVRKLLCKNMTERSDSIPDSHELGSTRMAVCSFEAFRYVVVVLAGINLCRVGNQIPAAFLKDPNLADHPDETARRERTATKPKDKQLIVGYEVVHQVLVAVF